MTSVIFLFSIVNYLISLIIGFKQGEIKGAFRFLGFKENQERYYYLLLLIILPVSIIFIIAFKSAPAETTIGATIASGFSHGISALVISVLYITPLYGLTFISAVVTGRLIKELLKTKRENSLVLAFLIAAILGNHFVWRGLTELRNMADPYPLIF